MKNQCIAIAEGNRINLLIRKGDPGYTAFADILDQIEKNGCLSWYGDIPANQSGLVITFKPREREK